MPARWVDLLIRINYVLDDADARLIEGERNLFYSHLLATAHRRYEHPEHKQQDHPIPGRVPQDLRNPAGD